MNAALDWTARLLAWSLLLQTLELWSLRTALAADFPWSIVRQDHRGVMRRVLDAAFSARGFPVAIGAQGMLALALPITRSALVPWLALTMALLLAARFRGNFNGGSDAMTLLVLLGLAIARTPSQWPLAELGLGYITAQKVLSYFVAGLWKLRSTDWRRGRALPKLASAPQYRAPAWFAKLCTVPSFARLASWSVLGFECAFPLALWSAPLARALSVVGVAFHLSNALALGLNRFHWAWLAAYPALWFWTLRA